MHWTCQKFTDKNFQIDAGPSLVVPKKTVASFEKLALFCTKVLFQYPQGTDDVQIFFEQLRKSVFELYMGAFWSIYLHNH